MENTRKLGIFIPAGTAHLRAPSGTETEEVPIYIEVDAGRNMSAAKSCAMVQAGQIARRRPGGEPLPATPIYIQADEQAERAEAAGHTDFARFCAKVMGRYLKECEAAGLTV